MSASTRFLIVLSTIAAAGCLATLPIRSSEPVLVQGKGEDGAFLNGFFPIAVFGQPVESFAKWKGRGINTLVEVPQNHDASTWDRAARERGFRIIRRPLNPPSADIGRKDLLAWSHWDEPDAAGRAPEWTPAIEKVAAEWRRIDPNRKIYINFAGPDISWFTTRGDAYSRNYSSFYPRLIASADWVANDIYPNGGWLNDGHKGRRGDTTLIGEPMKAIRRLTNKPQFVYIEASEIEQGNVPGARCPTSNQMRSQIWYAITQGARGIVYFPAVVGKRGFNFDGAPSELVSEMTRQNADLAQLGPVLQTAINPTQVSVSASSGVSVGWRISRGMVYVIAVNPTDSPLSNVNISVKGAKTESATLFGSNEKVKQLSGQLVDSFAPHGVRIYVLPVE